MSEPEVMTIVTDALNELLRWVGFGTLAGLTGKAIMPGRDPGGAVTTLLMGIMGAVIGCGSVAFFWDGAKVDPISGPGFLAATGGTFVLLAAYRMMSGSFYVEQDGVEDRAVHVARRRRRRRSMLSRFYDYDAA